MMDLSALPVTPQELDAWLRTTDVEDEPSQQEQQHQQQKKTTPPLPDLGGQSPSAAAASSKHGKTVGKTLVSQRQQQSSSTRRRRRSSLDCASAPQFGIDERTALMANRSGRSSNGQQQQRGGANAIAVASLHRDPHGDASEASREVIRLVSEGDEADNYSSPASSINSSVDRNAALSFMKPMMFTMDHRRSSSTGLPNTNNGSGLLPPTMLSRRDSAGSRCSATCASSDTVHRNNFSITKRGYDCVTPLGNSASSPAPAMLLLNRSASSMSNGNSSFQEEGNYSPHGGGYARSVSLPDSNNGRQAHADAAAALQHSHSLPTPSFERRHSSQVDSQRICKQQFMIAMEKSQQSQDYIHSGPRPPSQSLRMMRETNRSRGMLLSMLNKKKSATNTESSSRRTSASQAIISHNNANNHGISNHRTSTSNNDVMHHHQPQNMRRTSSGSMGGGGFRQQDMRNMMLRSIQMNNEEELMMNSMMNKKIENGSYWRPASKQQQQHTFSSLSSTTCHDVSYPSKVQQQQRYHHQQMKIPMQMRPEERSNHFVDTESAVKAELQRIAREQMMTMGQQEQQHLQQSIY